MCTTYNYTGNQVPVVTTLLESVCCPQCAIGRDAVAGIWSGNYLNLTVRWSEFSLVLRNPIYCSFRWLGHAVYLSANTGHLQISHKNKTSVATKCQQLLFVFLSIQTSLLSQRGYSQCVAVPSWLTITLLSEYYMNLHNWILSQNLKLQRYKERNHGRNHQMEPQGQGTLTSQQINTWSHVCHKKWLPYFFL